MNFSNRSKIEYFQHQLRETIAWCALQDWSFHIQSMREITSPPLITHGKGLRTDLLRPPKIENNMRAIFNAIDPDQKTMEIIAIEETKIKHQWQQNVELVTTKRAELMQAQNISSAQITFPLIDGRLLVYDPNMSTDDGAADFATQGFFDASNVPPWDTWLVYMIDDYLIDNAQSYSYLLSWVPDPLIKVVDLGLDRNWEECVFWATDLDTVFTRQLRQAGLIRC